MRQFVSSREPEKDGTLLVTGKDCRYLSRVLRLRVGDTIDVSLPGGLLAPMSAASIAKDSLLLVPCGAGSGEGTATRAKVQGVVAGAVQSAFEGVPELWLFQFLPKPQKMDFIVRAATECGVARIVPVRGEFSVRGAGAAERDARRERWTRIVREARQQSGSPVETQVAEVSALVDALAGWAAVGSRAGFVLHEDPACGTSALFEAHGTAAPGQGDSAALDGGGRLPKVVALAVGSEGGISPAEMDALLGAGFAKLHFATNVLRAETAAVYGIAVVQQHFARVARTLGHNGELQGAEK